jgi:hypothetical protein
MPVPTRTDATCHHFTCPRCGTVSHHPDDLKHGYCGRCHDFTGIPAAQDAAWREMVELGQEIGGD